MSGEPSPPAATGQNASASEPGMTPPRPPDATRSGRDTIPTGGLIGPLGYSGEDPEERERRLRWGPPPDDWRSYWDRKRHERDWYPDYSGPQRYPNDDYYEPPRSHAPPRSSGVYRSGSMRERGPPVSYRTGRYAYAPERGSFEREREARPRGSISARTPKDDVEEYYDSEEDITYARRGGAGGGGGRGGGQGPLPTDGSEGMRLPFTGWLNSVARGHFIATLGEFIGTTMFLLFAFAGTQVANIGARTVDNTTTGGQTGFSPEVLQYIALSFGFSLMVNVWIFFRISGGLFNPAVTLGMVLVKAITVPRALLLTGAQLVGAIFASFLVDKLFPTSFNVRTTLSADTSLARGVFIEAVLTAELVFTIFMLAKEKHKATFIAPVGMGLALFVAELVGVFYTGGSLNPARSFGPCVVTGTFDKEHWIYWVGPAVGATGAVLFYNFIKILEYEMANPGQDEEDPEEAGRKARELHEDKIRQASRRDGEV